MSADRTRRHVLGDAIAGLAGAMVVAGAGIAVATPETLASEQNPDAELIAISERHRLIIAEQHRIERTAEDDEFDDLVAKGTDVLSEMVPIRALTARGLQAKALALAADDTGTLESSEHACPDLDLVASLIADLLGIEVSDTATIQRLQAGRVTVAQLAAFGGASA